MTIPGEPLSTYVPGLLSIGLGAYALLARSWLARLATRWNYRLLRVQVDQRDLEISAIVGGIGLIAIGMLVLGGVIRFSAP